MSPSSFWNTPPNHTMSKDRREWLGPPAQAQKIPARTNTSKRRGDVALDKSLYSYIHIYIYIYIYIHTYIDDYKLCVQ